jgi:hypothetical protein
MVFMSFAWNIVTSKYLQEALQAQFNLSGL